MSAQIKRLLGFLGTIATIAAAILGYLQWQESKGQADTFTDPQLVLAFVDQSDPEFLGIVLRNTGPGRAQVGTINLWVDKKRIGDANDDSWLRTLALLGLKGDRDVHFLAISSNAFLKSDGELRLLGVLHKNATPAQKQALYAARDRLQFSACYCSSRGLCKPLLSPGLVDNPCEWANPITPKQDRIQ